jgi:hypothetical protein
MITNGDRTGVVAFLQQKRSQGSYTVIDVGGSAGGWSRDVIDALVDCVEQPGLDPTTIRHFKCDINVESDWVPILEHVKLHGKFDFSICTHTLEDIRNPLGVAQKLEAISQQGYIAVPSKFRELSIGIESPHYRGYIHHRWIFDITNGVLTGYPKLVFLERNARCDTIADNSDDCKDLNLFWTNTIGLSLVNNDFLGPTIPHVHHMYEPLFSCP